MNKKFSLLSAMGIALLPVIAFAQVSFNGSATSTGCDLSTLGGWLCKIGSLLNSVVPVLIALAVVFFVWGVVSYVISDDEEAKEKGRNRIIYGVIGLVVIVGVWGLVRVVGNTFGLNNANQNFVLPTVPVVLETPQR